METQTCGVVQKRENRGREKCEELNVRVKMFNFAPEVMWCLRVCVCVWCLRVCVCVRLIPCCELLQVFPAASQTDELLEAFV